MRSSQHRVELSVADMDGPAPPLAREPRACWPAQFISGVLEHLTTLLLGGAAAPTVCKHSCVVASEETIHQGQHTVGIQVGGIVAAAAAVDVIIREPV